MTSSPYGRKDKNYDAFDSARLAIRRTPYLPGNDPAVADAVKHFDNVFSLGPRDPRDTQKAAAWWSNKRITLGFERGAADPYTHEAFVFGDVAVTLRAKAFKNVMDAYLTLVLALARSVEPGFMDETTRQAFREAGAPELPAALKWMDVTDRIRQAQRSMEVYGSAGGQLTVGLNYQDLPGFYDAFVTAVRNVADEALRTRGDISKALLTETGYEGIANPARDPISFMSAAQRALSDWGKKSVAERRQQKYDAERQRKEQFKRLKDAPRRESSRQGAPQPNLVGAFEDMLRKGFPQEAGTGFDFGAAPQPTPAKVPAQEAPQSTGFASIFEVEDTVVGAEGVADAFSAFDFNSNPRSTRRLPRSPRGRF